jgi:phosphatidylglycerol---prolipoprotein diacylglyceryl transferase
MYIAGRVVFYASMQNASHPRSAGDLARRDSKSIATCTACRWISAPMINYPPINPNLLQIGPLRVRWYGIMYLIGFFCGRVIFRHLCRQNLLRMSIDLVDDFLVALFVGMLIGARLLYMLVYFQPAPGESWHWYTLFAVWEGGLSFHGAAIGMFAAIGWFAWRHKVRYWNLGDALCLAAPLGIAFGRIGNFINAELWGRETTVPWAMRFPLRDMAGNVLDWTTPRHPSQLYESLGEGLLTLAVAWTAKRRVKYQGQISAVAISCYAIVRFVIEFFREKDEQLAYYFGWMTMGQILCALMLLIGIALFFVMRARAIPVDAPAVDSADSNHQDAE